MPGLPPEVVPDADLPAGRHANPNFEFGCLLIQATALTLWGPIGATGPVLPATVYVNPQTINTKAKGQYITAYIESDGSWNVAESTSPRSRFGRSTR